MEDRRVSSPSCIRLSVIRLPLTGLSVTRLSGAPCARAFPCIVCPESQEGLEGCGTHNQRGRPTVPEFPGEARLRPTSVLLSTTSAS